MASASGIDVKRVDLTVFCLGSGVAGLAGVMLALLGPVTPNVGQSYIIPAFLVVVMGGLGSIVGTTASAIILGLFAALAQIFVDVSVAHIAARRARWRESRALSRLQPYALQGRRFRHRRDAGWDRGRALHPPRGRGVSSLDRRCPLDRDGRLGRDRWPIQPGRGDRGRAARESCARCRVERLPRTMALPDGCAVAAVYLGHTA